MRRRQVVGAAMLTGLVAVAAGALTRSRSRRAGADRQAWNDAVIERERIDRDFTQAAWLKVGLVALVVCLLAMFGILLPDILAGPGGADPAAADVRKLFGDAQDLAGQGGLVLAVALFAVQVATAFVPAGRVEPGMVLQDAVEVQRGMRARSVVVDVVAAVTAAVACGVLVAVLGRLEISVAELAILIIALLAAFVSAVAPDGVSLAMQILEQRASIRRLESSLERLPRWEGQHAWLVSRWHLMTIVVVLTVSAVSPGSLVTWQSLARGVFTVTLVPLLFWAHLAVLRALLTALAESWSTGLGWQKIMHTVLGYVLMLVVSGSYALVAFEVAIRASLGDPATWWLIWGVLMWPLLAVGLAVAPRFSTGFGWTRPSSLIAGCAREVVAQQLKRKRSALTNLECRAEVRLPHLNHPKSMTPARRLPIWS